MSASKAAAEVATIALAFAHRRRNGVGHTGHTVNRLLDAVSALLGRRVGFIDGAARARTDEPAERAY